MLLLNKSDFVVKLERWTVQNESERDSFIDFRGMMSEILSEWFISFI